MRKDKTQIKVMKKIPSNELNLNWERTRKKIELFKNALLNVKKSKYNLKSKMLAFACLNPFFKPW